MPPRHEPGPPETLTDTDYANLLRVPDRRSLAGKRDYALLRVLSDCGLRSAELRGLRAQDLRRPRSNARHVRLHVRGKGGREREVPVPEAVQQAVDPWVTVHPLARGIGLRDEHPLFVRLGRHAHEDPVALSAEAVYRLVHRHCLVAGVPDRLAHPHALRSYWATHCLEAGVSVHEVREPTPNRRSWPAFQTVGEQLLRDGWRGLLAPSAARPGALNRDSERPGEMDVIVRKNRQGRLGQVTTRIDKRLRYHRVLAQNVGDTAPF